MKVIAMPTLLDLLALDCTQHPAAALTTTEIAQLMNLMPHWQIVSESIQRRFGFSDFHQTMAFVNAVADVAHRADHHPDLQVSYSECTIAYTTHSIGGLSLNDFACAARIDALWGGKSP